ncbi:RecQ family ATP-dependent DNA helicase [Abyssalbus ytuae]|uniref:ATP-dependent DNA helicase RecQ n=1 Tax=Abyssalbus ytuae TaxID=2926907 RepID=A0A9E6ZL83_9FLAO|nr:ATP-dependent DNA helicase RecQ [Abyssalbus ytuae]UOB17837.1 RecQ family ATP-dependent DNA helicase [Abyssalbus ytuae]
MLYPHEILKKYWKFETFKSPQEEIIESVLNNIDTLALLPTGGGKSVCFQVPALAKQGICIVISPLVALINDQVENLKKKGIKAIALTGGLKYEEVDTMLDNCIYGNYKFLYLSPERLQQELVLDRIKQMPVSLIAVDEAHCISEWGHDFRPAYRNCYELRKVFPHINIIALTASATPEVAKDIIDNLQLENTKVFKKSFARPNISLRVIDEIDKLYRTELILKKTHGSSIIYVRNRKACIDISNLLNEKGVSSTFYHGGISSDEKNKKLNQWLNNEVKTMVATNAFGMGIDKPDVRTVIHLSLPDTLENYYQEAGRCGRDGKKAQAVILKNKDDENQVKQQFLSVLPNVEFVKLVYRKLNNYFQVPYGEGENNRFSLHFNNFCKTYSFKPTLTYNAMKVLDKYSIISLSENFNKKTTLQFITSNHELFKYMDRNPGTENICQSILRTYGGIFDMETKVNTSLIAAKTSSTEEKVYRVLKQLENDNIIKCNIQNTDAEITFLVPREDDKTINVIAKYIKQQNILKAKKVQAVINYMNNNEVCKSIQLLNYFGEKNTPPCGICSVCKSNNNKNSTEILNAIAGEIIRCLKKQPLSSRDLIQNLTFNEEAVLYAIQMLLEQEKITINQINQYQIIE